MTHSELVDAYVRGGEALRREVEGMSAADLQAKPVAGKWSTLEVVCHLADTDGLFAERIRRVLTEDRPPLPYADENRAITALAYSRRNLAEELACIDGIRRQMATILRAQPAEAWHRVGIHSSAGELSLETIVGKAVSHLDHHLKFIREKKAALGS